jgi:hypothetical protein
MAEKSIQKFVAVSPGEKFIRIGNDGYAHEVEDVGSAQMCASEQDAERYFACWINLYPEKFSTFKIIPITISYDSNKD